MPGHKNLVYFPYFASVILLQPSDRLKASVRGSNTFVSTRWLAGLQSKQLTNQPGYLIVQAVNRRLLTTKVQQSLGYPQYEGWSGLPENPGH
jgi:hypothetical protein